MSDEHEAHIAVSRQGLTLAKVNDALGGYIERTLLEQTAAYPPIFYRFIEGFEPDPELVEAAFHARWEILTRWPSTTRAPEVDWNVLVAPHLTRLLARWRVERARARRLRAAWHNDRWSDDDDD